SRQVQEPKIEHAQGGDHHPDTQDVHRLHGGYEPVGIGELLAQPGARQPVGKMLDHSRLNPVLPFASTGLRSFSAHSNSSSCHSRERLYVSVWDQGFASATGSATVISSTRLSGSPLAR